MDSGTSKWIERLEMRALLASIAADLSFGKLGEAPVDGQLLIAPVAGEKILAVGANKVERLNGDGSNDSTFKDPGRPAVDAGMKIFLGGALQTSSQIILGGEVATSDPFDFESDTLFFQSLNLSNGHADPTFGKDGVAEIKVGAAIKGFTLSNLSVLNLAPSADGGMYVFVDQGGANTSDEGRELAVVYKLTAKGVLDSTFGTGGQLAIPAIGSSWHTAGADPSGRIWAIYDINDDDDADAHGQFIMRLNPDGSVDKTFGTKGTLRLNDGDDGDPRYEAIAFQSSGKPIVVSETDGNEGSEYDVSRLTLHGSIDPNFTIFGLGEQILNIAIDSQDRIIANTTDELIRSTPHGYFDDTFDDNGTAMLPRALSQTRSAIALDGSDNILLGTPRRVTRFVKRARVVLLGGVLRIDGSEGVDRLQITGDASTITVDVLTGESQTFDATKVSSFSIFLGGGGNKLQLEVDLPASIVSGSGDDTISTGDGVNSIDSGMGNDAIVTGDGGDEISAGGDSTITTGDGDDQISAEDNASIISGGGDDTIKIANDDQAHEQFVTINAGAGNDQITFNHSNFGADAAGATIHGGDGDDVITASDDEEVNTNSLYGDAGNDTIHGSIANDYISGGGGKDRLYGADGDDSIIGGDGYDRIQGLAGNDTIGGQAGNDLISGGDGADVLGGGGGNDTLDGGTGSDTIHGNAGDDLISANHGVADQIFGDGGRDSACIDKHDTTSGVESLIS